MREEKEEIKKIVEPIKSTADWLIDEIKWLVRVFVSSSDRFYWDNGFSKAAALAYTALLSLVPMLALSFGILGAFLQRGSGDHQEVQGFILKQFIPSESAQQILPYISEFQESFQTLNILAVASLLFTSLLLLNTIEFTLNQVWQVFELRSITHRITIFCSIILTLPALAVSAYYTSTSFVAPMFARSDFLTRVYQEALPLLIDFLAFLMLYYLVPKAPVKIGPAAFGALFSSLVFGWSKGWFAWYLHKFSAYQTVYGTIALVPIFLLWLYVAWTIVLYGAEISFQIQNLPRKGTLWKRSVMAVGDGAMVLALQTLVLIARAFREGSKPPNELEIAEHLGCSSVVLKPTLDSLERSKIIMRGDSRDMPLLLMQSPEAINLLEVQEAILKKKGNLLFTNELAKVWGASVEDKMAEKSLADIL